MLEEFARHPAFSPATFYSPGVVTGDIQLAEERAAAQIVRFPEVVVVPVPPLSELISDLRRSGEERIKEWV